jgi:hypothetical protein
MLIFEQVLNTYHNLMLNYFKDVNQWQHQNFEKNNALIWINSIYTHSKMVSITKMFVKS